MEYATTAEWRQLHVALAGAAMSLSTVGSAVIVAAMLSSPGRHAWSVRMLLTLSSAVDLVLLYVACGNRLVEDAAGPNLIQVFIRHSSASCVLYHVASGFLNQLGVWLYVCMAVENYLSCRRSCASRRGAEGGGTPAGDPSSRAERVNHGVLLLCALFLIVNMSPFWTVELQKDELSSASQQKLCFYVQRFERFSTSIYPVLDLVLRAALPTLLICGATAAVWCRRSPPPLPTTAPRRRQQRQTTWIGVCSGAVSSQGGGSAPIDDAPVDLDSAAATASPPVDGRLPPDDDQRRVYTAMPLAFLLASAPRLAAVCAELAHYSEEASSRPGVSTLLRLHGRLTDGHALADMVYFAFVSAKVFVLLAASANFRTCLTRRWPAACRSAIARAAASSRFRRRPYTAAVLSADPARGTAAAAGPLYRSSAQPTSATPLIVTAAGVL